MIQELALARGIDQNVETAARTTITRAGQRLNAEPADIELVLEILFAPAIS